MEKPRGLPVQALWWLVVQVTVIIAWVFLSFADAARCGVIYTLHVCADPSWPQSAAPLRVGLHGPHDRSPRGQNSGSQD